MDNGKLNESMSAEETTTKTKTTTTSSCISVQICGLKTVGKTTILHQFQHLVMEDKKSKRDNYLPATAPQLQFSEAIHYPISSLRKMAIKSAEAFVLVYAVDDEESFDYVIALLGQIIEIKGYGTPLVVVGNKIDKPDRKVHPIIADCMITIDYESKHKEISATSHKDINEVLSCLLDFFVACPNTASEKETTPIPANSLKKRLSVFFGK